MKRHAAHAPMDGSALRVTTIHMTGSSAAHEDHIASLVSRPSVLRDTLERWKEQKPLLMAAKSAQQVMTARKALSISCKFHAR